jgi:hypothetical protein
MEKTQAVLLQLLCAKAILVWPTEAAASAGLSVTATALRETAKQAELEGRYRVPSARQAGH